MAEKTLNLNDLKKMVESITRQSLKEHAASVAPKKSIKVTKKQLREMIREALSEEDKIPEEMNVTLEQLREMIRDGVLESMDKELTKKLRKSK